MQNGTTSVLGFDVPVSGFPTTVPECVESAGGEQNLVDGFVAYRKFHNTNTEARSAVVDALEKVTGIKRETEQKKSPTKADPNRMITVPAESEQQYADRVRAQTSQTTEQLWASISGEVGTIEFKGKGEPREGGPGRVGKEDAKNAQTLIDSDKWAQAIDLLQAKNPGLNVDLDEATGKPVVESLAAALRTNRARIAKEANEALGLAA